MSDVYNIGMGGHPIFWSRLPSTMVSLGSYTTLVIAFATASVFLEAAEAGVFIPILQQDQNVDPDGSYRYSYATANGIMVSEQGRLQRLGPDTEAKTVDGSYTYLNADGTLVNVKYVADEQGFRAVPSVVYRPQALTRGLSPEGDVHFHNYDSLRYALRL